MDKTFLLTIIIGGSLVYFKQFFLFLFENIKNLLITSLKIEESSYFFYSFQNFILTEYNQRVNNYYYRNFFDDWIGKDTNINLFYSSGFISIKFEGVKFLVLKNQSLIQNSFNPFKDSKQHFQIFCFNKNKLNDLLNYVDTKYGSNFIKYYYNANGEVKCAGKVINKTFDNIYLDEGVIDDIKKDLDMFQSSRQTYDQYGIRYKRTYLFYGPPGTGKSSLSLGISNYTKRDILSINMSKDITDSNLITLISNRPNKSIILFEDIDCLLGDIDRNQETKEKEVKISLSCILNILDGIYTPNDVIFIITTNDLSKIDDAIKRKGRTDVLMEIKKPDQKLIDTLKQQFDISSDKEFDNISEIYDEILTKN
jgi:DNA replication protein DnaC